MTNPHTRLLDLAARCEAGEGADRLLDAEIALTQGWIECAGDNWIGPRAEICVPAYTASLDAAMTLVPEGWHLSLQQWPIPLDSERHENGQQRFWSKDQWRATLTEDGGAFGQVHPVASTPALALCAASLRALAGQLPAEVGDV